MKIEEKLEPMHVIEKRMQGRKQLSSEMRGGWMDANWKRAQPV
jgi:hypothetical protein